MLIMLLGLIKLPIAALMLWLPFHNDEAMRTPDVRGSSDEDGGSLTLPGGAPDPHPRFPAGPSGGGRGARPPRRPSHPAPVSRRRGPHGTPLPSAPRRIHAAAVTRRVERP